MILLFPLTRLLGAFRYENIDGNEKRKKRAIGFKVMFIEETLGNDDFLRNTAFECWNNAATIWINFAILQRCVVLIIKIAVANRPE